MKTVRFSNPPKSRRLHIETLEERQLPAVRVAEFNPIRAQDSDLNLSANRGDDNVIEAGGPDPVHATDSFAFSAAGLRSAVARAGNTTQNDLIVVRATAAQNTLPLGGSELFLNIDAATRGSVTLVSPGDAALTLPAAMGTAI